jgi:hypothetical protein
MEPINVGIKTIQDEKCLDDNAKVMFLVVKRKKKHFPNVTSAHSSLAYYMYIFKKKILEIILVLNGIVRPRFYNCQSLFVST